MLGILCILIWLIIVAYLLRLGYFYVVKQQRLDWPLERKRFNHELNMMYRISRRITRWYWRP